MSDCNLYSLSGNLSLKYQLAFLHINTEKRLWFVLNESCLQLESYLCEKDFHLKSTPLNQISLIKSAIIPSLCEENQFVILSDNEKFELKADNHESYLIWIRELQKKRNIFYRTNNIDEFQNELVYAEDNDDVLKYLEAEEEEENDSEDTLSSNSTSSTISNNKKFQLTLNRFKMNSIESFDSAFSDSKMTALNSNDSTSSFILKYNRSLEKEIIKLKSELAFCKDKENEYEKLLLEKDELINALNKRILDLSMNYKENGIFQIRNRVNDENEVLRNEIIYTKSILSEDEAKFQHFKNEIKGLKSENNRLKIDYLNILQSFLACSIDYRVSNGSNENLSLNNLSLCNNSISVQSSKSLDTSFSIDSSRRLSLYGGDKHKNRLRELLEECRKKDPTLPSWESITSSDFFVDKYGFKYNKANENFLIHYICQQLNLFYDSQPKVHEDSLWRIRLIQWKKSFNVNSDIKRLVRNGIMPKHRTEFWKICINKHVADIKKSKGPNYYKFLCNLINELPKEVTKFHHQIYLDLLRTLPNNVKFSSKYSQGVNQLQEVLQVFCLHNPSIGYCQGMNFIVGISLLFLEPEDAFWCLVVITEKLFLPHYFDSGLVGAQADQQCLKNLIELKLPDLHDHLESLELDLSSITLNWFLAIFIDALPFETMLRIWDCFLLEGSKILFRYSLALLHMHKNTLMENNDTISIFKSLKYSVKFTFDIDGLNKIAFEQLEPFPKRKEIIQKQKNYLRIKLESWKSRRLQKINQDIIEWDSENDEQNFHLKIDCSSFVDGNFVWVCYGGQMEGNVMIGDLEMKKMSVQNIVTESKILSIVAIEEFDLVLMGLLSGNLIGFNSVNKEQLWNLNLKDSILNMLSVKAETNFYRLYCAHSNGKLTYIELDSDKEPSEIFDINVSSSPIEWIELVIDDHEEKYIWLASANTVYVYNERTLLNETKFEVSVNQFDHILMLKHTKNGVLLSIKGSSIIHLYDYNTYKCKLLFDVKLNLKLSIEKDDDFSFSRNRLTCFLSLDNNLIWFGTGDGYLLIYSIEIYEQKKIDKLHKKFSLNTQIFKRIMSRRNFSLATDFNLDYIYHERAKLNVKRRDSSLPDKFLDKNSKKEMKKFKSEFILKDISKHLYIPSENEFKINICNNYDLEYKMDLLTKAKISDQPVRTIMSKKVGDEIVVITCSGNYGEDETVLKWSQKDKNWKNEPFIEMCPITNIPKRPLYAKIEYFQNLKNKKETKKFF